MKKLIVVVTMFIFLFPFQSLIVRADEVKPDINDFKEYDSFMKRYNEHASELMYITSVSYGSNEHYFSENMDLFRNAIKSIYDYEEGGFIDGYLNSTEDLFKKPLALLLSANDFRKELFNKIKGFFTKKDYDSVGYVVGSASFKPPEGYAYKVSGFDDYFTNAILGSDTGSFTSYFYFSTGGNQPVLYIPRSDVQRSYPDELDFYDLLKTKHAQGTLTIADFFDFHETFSNRTITLVKIDTHEEKPVYNDYLPQSLADSMDRIINNTTNYNYPVDYEPVVQPQLVCPNEVVPLTYETGTFKTLEGQVVTISEDETANYLQTLCNLDFSFPEIIYHDSTNTLLVGDEDLSPVKTGVGDYDVSVIEYLRNSYNYAVNVVNSGVNGLKSIITGTTGLVAFTGSLFGFLPPEILTLFIGGFSIALGLWVFKR